MEVLRNQFCGKFKDTGICLVIFLSALFIIITISNPGLYMNDEWVTVNQVHQLNLGHQITINEGKYGVFKNGTPGAYFASLSNILKYSAALSVSSMPAMKMIDLFGDNFRFALILLWAFLPFLIALFISWCYPEQAEIGSIRITVLGAVVGFLLLAVNILVYSPFVYSAPDAPVEVAAVVFTNHLFFSLTVVMAFLIARQIFESRWKALFAALTAAASSAYLFWGTNAKDHMMTAAVFAVTLYFFVCYFRSRNFRDAACGFFFIGILAWIRPEIGFTALLCLGLFFIADVLLRIRKKQDFLQSGIIHIGAILFTAIGAIPFFINNLVISGNPLVPVLLLSEQVRTSSTIVGVVPIAPVANASHIVVTVNPLIIVGDFISTLGQYIFTISPNPLADLYGVLFFPKSGSMGFFFIVPIALLALILFPLFVIKKNVGKNAFSQNTEIAMLMLVAAFSVFLAYLRILNNMNTDPTIGPDIRYLSTAYLPVILLSLMALEKTILMANPKTLVKQSCILGLILVPVLFLIAIIYPMWSTDLSFLILTEVMVIAALTAFYHITGRQGDSLSDFCIPVLVITVLSWQLRQILFLSPLIYLNGYPFWIPGIDLLFHHFFTVTM
jgi:hypothetical protein